MTPTTHKENGREAERLAQAQAHVCAPAQAHGRVMGIAHDMACVGQALIHIANGEGVLANVSNDNLEFVAIGLQSTAWDITIPALARNKVTGEWIWAKALIWCEPTEEHAGGFVWSQGHYTYDEQEAREEFRALAHFLLYTTEAY